MIEDLAKGTKVDYGKLDFEIIAGGPVWMLTTARFRNSGNSDGNWQSEAVPQTQLENSGWRVIARDITSEYGYAPAGQNSSLMDWILFERTCKTGERFSIRTEKYQSPVILRNVAAAENPSGLRLKAVGRNTDLDVLLSGSAPGYYRIFTSTDLVSWSDAGAREMLQDGLLRPVHD